MRNDQQPRKSGSHPEVTSETSASASTTTDGQSRRNFLRTAIISGVAVATIGSSAGVVVEACAPHPGILKRFGINLGSASGAGHCTMCIESIEYDHIASFMVHNNHASPPEFFIWFTAHNLAPGSYTMGISPDPTNSSSPIRLASSGNNASLFLVDANKAYDCPTCDRNGAVVMNCPTCGPKSPVRKSHSVDGLFSTAYSFSGSNHDLQLQVHVKWDGATLASDKTLSFTGTLKDGQGTVVCTSSVSVTARH